MKNRGNKRKIKLDKQPKKEERKKLHKKAKDMKKTNPTAKIHYIKKKKVQTNVKFSHTFELANLSCVCFGIACCMFVQINSGAASPSISRKRLCCIKRSNIHFLVLSHYLQLMTSSI